MIDLATEDLIPISQVPERLPRRPNGRKIHISCVYRWMLHGLQGGRIRLETIKVGGSTFSSAQAIQRFADALTGSRNSQPTPVSRMSRSRQAQAAHAARQVRQQLGINPSPASQDGIKRRREVALHVGDDLDTQEPSSATNSASTPSNSRKANSRLVHAPCGANSQQPQAQQQQQVDQFTGSKPAADMASKGTST